MEHSGTGWDGMELLQDGAQWDRLGWDELLQDGAQWDRRGEDGAPTGWSTVG